MSCKKAQGFLAKHAITVREQVDARKVRLGEKNALALAERATRVIVAKGKKVAQFKRDPKGYDKAELLAAMLGPTGNLRAPAILRGKTLLVGFNEEVYHKELS